MDAASALIAGFAAGLAIAVQVGAVSLLLIDTALVAGPRAGLAAGMGVATADLTFALLAALGGGAAGAALAGHESQIHIVAGATLAGIGVHGLIGLVRERADGDRLQAVRGEAARSARAQYVRLLAITAVNPLTIASFAAVAASLSLQGLAPYLAFVAGVGAASAAWHGCLTLTAAHVGRWITPRVHRGLGFAGRVGILILAARLALGG